LTTKSRGGARPNSGRKKTDYVPMEVLIPEKDKEAIRAIFGRSFNQLFRDWVKTLLK